VQHLSISVVTVASRALIAGIMDDAGRVSPTDMCGSDHTPSTANRPTSYFHLSCGERRSQGSDFQLRLAAKDGRTRIFILVVANAAAKAVISMCTS